MSVISASDFLARSCSTCGMPLRTDSLGNLVASPFSASCPRVSVSLRAKSIVSTSGMWKKGSPVAASESRYAGNAVAERPGRPCVVMLDAESTRCP